MGKNILVYDLETSGLPIFPKQEYGVKTVKENYGFHKHTENDKYDSSRILSIGWVLIKNCSQESLTQSETVIKECLRKPHDFSDTGPIHIHGITLEMVQEKGIPLEELITNEKFGEALLNCDIIAGHNILFDIFVLMNELNRIGFNEHLAKLQSVLDESKYFCTAALGKDICKIKFPDSKYEGYKFPRLSEMYFFYYNENPPDQHKASGDVLAVVKILQKMIAQ